MRRLLAALGLEGLLLAVRTLSVTRLRFRLSAPSLHPKSEEFFCLYLLDFPNALRNLPDYEKASSAPLWGSTSSFISSFISSSLCFLLPSRICFQQKEEKTMSSHVPCCVQKKLVTCTYATPLAVTFFLTFLPCYSLSLRSSLNTLLNVEHSNFT